MAAAVADPPQGRELWRAFAGPFAHLPPTGTRVYYFPRGHADQCGGIHPPPADDAIPCTVLDVAVHYRPVSGDPYAVISLQREQEPFLPQPPAPAAPQHQEDTGDRYYVKKFTATSDRAPYTVAKDCAQELLPPQVPIAAAVANAADNRQEQTLHMLDVNGVDYGIKHILKHRGSDVLSAGWNDFADHKEFSRMGQDAFILMRRADDTLIIGSRRDAPSRDLALELVHHVSADIAAAAAAAVGQQFNVTYYPRQGWPFVVPRKEVDDALQINWQEGMKVSMASPEDIHELQSSRRQPDNPNIFWGVITNVNNNNQYWCKLQVAWDEPSTPNSNVNVWQVEAVVESEEEDGEDAVVEVVEEAGDVVEVVEEAGEGTVVEAGVEPSTKRCKTSDAPSSLPSSE